MLFVEHCLLHYLMPIWAVLHMLPRWVNSPDAAVPPRIGPATKVFEQKCPETDQSNYFSIVWGYSWNRSVMLMPQTPQSVHQDQCCVSVWSKVTFNGTKPRKPGPSTSTSLGLLVRWKTADSCPRVQMSRLWWCGQISAVSLVVIREAAGSSVVLSLSHIQICNI